MKITLLDRLLLLAAGLLAAWQVAVGIDGADTLPLLAYTAGFGALLIAGLLLVILGYEALESPIVAIFSTVIPLGLAIGLAWEYWPPARTGYLVFALAGFLAVLVTRAWPRPGRLPVFVLAAVHGVAGMTIFLLPLLRSLAGEAAPGFALVSLGGALIGAGGLLLSFLRAGRPLLGRATLYRVLPGLLFATTAAFVAGFALA